MAVRHWGNCVGAGVVLVGVFAGCADNAPAPVKPAAPPAGVAKPDAGDAADEQLEVPPEESVESTKPVDDLSSEAPGEGPAIAMPDELPDDPPVKVLLGTAELTAGIPGEGPLTVEEIRAWLDRPENHEILDFELPLGLKSGSFGKELATTAPLTRAKIELGRQLYFDTRLSADGTISCATCHHPDEGWARHTQFGEGIGGQKGGRNSPVSYNRIASGAQFWDGRAATLEEQAVGPIANPIEMGNTHDVVVTTLQGIEGYRLQFERIFGAEKVTIDDVGRAIAAFERAVVTGPAPYDYQAQLEPLLKLTEEDFAEDAELKADYEAKLAQAQAHPMSESAKRGQVLFFSEKINCAHCHVGANFSDEKYHNLGVGMDKPEPDLGRFAVTKDEKDKGAFKTPTIRNVAITAPYMHDGSQKTLLEVVEHYQKGGTPNPYLSAKIVKLELTDQDKQDLVAFMEACTGEFPPVEAGRLPE